MHHTDWTGGLVALVHRFAVLCFAWDAQHDRILHDLLDAGLDAVYSAHTDRLTDALARAETPRPTARTHIQSRRQTRLKERPPTAASRSASQAGRLGESSRW